MIFLIEQSLNFPKFDFEGLKKVKNLRQQLLPRRGDIYRRGGGSKEQELTKCLLFLDDDELTDEYIKASREKNVIERSNMMMDLACSALSGTSRAQY